MLDRIVGVGLVGLLMAACASEPPPTTPEVTPSESSVPAEEEKAPEVTGLKLSPEVITLKGPEDSAQIQIQLVWADGSLTSPAEGEITWSVSDDSLLSVDAQGKLQVLGESGSVTVTAKYASADLSASVQVTLEKSSSLSETVNFTGEYEF